jgi:imidazolonepropionase-like amidohydrolase
MKAQGMYYDPTLTVYEAVAAVRQRKTELLDRSLVLGAGPLELIQSSKELIQSQPAEAAAASGDEVLAIAKSNLVEAWRAGVTLVTGSDAGNAIVLHGATVHREVELWVEAGIPPVVALAGATGNAAKLLHADNRIGFVKKGYEATLLLVDGNPLKDINAIESVSRVFLKGERVDRTDLFEEFDKKK